MEPTKKEKIEIAVASLSAATMIVALAIWGVRILTIYFPEVHL